MSSGPKCPSPLTSRNHVPSWKMPIVFTPLPDPIADDGHVAVMAELENVVDHVGPEFAVGGELHRPLAGGVLRRRGLVLLGAGRRIMRLRQPRLAADRPRIPAPSRAEHADVVLAVAIPIADHRGVARATELAIQIALIPDAVAIHIDEPFAVDIDAHPRRAVAGEIARDRNRPRSAEHVAQVGVAVAVVHRPLRMGEIDPHPGVHVESGGGELRLARRIGFARLAAVDHAEMPGVLIAARTTDGEILERRSRDRRDETDR